MTPEEKQLLFKDLCARLPYGVQCEIGGPWHGPYIFGRALGDIGDLIECREFKPYLRPMSSMTEEEKEEYNSFSLGEDWVSNKYYTVPSFNVLDWLLEHHFDYRGLIEKGLALEAPEGMYNK